jgi:hypothetical protein
MRGKWLCGCALVLVVSSSAEAQDPPPPIGPLVADVGGTLPRLSDDPALAASRGLSQAELPGRAIGVDVGAHVYPFRLGPVTIGLGAQVAMLRSRAEAEAPLQSVTAHFISLAPQLSINFGSGDGWSYISGGIGVSRLSMVPDGGQPQTADEAWVRTATYGAGARWFVKPHLAFHVDVRVHQVDPGPAQLTLPASPRMSLFIVSVGLSVK